MITTDKSSCRLVADLLVSHGVKHAVLCPGSRNAPIILAIKARSELNSVVVVDERSAAFMALGMSVTLSEPVAVVCTSGSAVLNCAPAVAEAFYRRASLVVISADRPGEWIDQDDSQTIRQDGVLANIVKGSWDIPVENGSAAQEWYINRMFNDAMLCACASPRGPVHVNLQLDAPLGRTAEYRSDRQRTISVINPAPQLSERDMAALVRRLLDSKRTLVIAGFMPPSEKASAALNSLSRRPSIAVMHEAQANVANGGRLISSIDGALSLLDDEGKRRMAPDLVITVGGSLVSRFVKKWLREAHPEHWHVGTQPYSVDCFMSLSKRIEMEPSDFLPQLADALARSTLVLSPYNELWSLLNSRLYAYDYRFLAKCPWSDYLAMEMMMNLVPRHWTLHVSNGTAVRYCQLFNGGRFSRIECNRGVSGIDGCTSTAIGASMVGESTTLLITGDMSAQYDVGALACSCIKPNFKMAVLNNGGGGIFRFIESTRSLPHLDECFCCDVRLPLADLSRAYGFAYFEARSAEELAAAWPMFAAETSRPAMLNVVTDARVSTATLNSYFEHADLAKRFNT